MGATPKYKVYDPVGNYVASVKEPEAGAAIISALYDWGPATIKLGHHKVLFTQGEDGDAGESYDEVARIVAEREAGRWPS